MRLDAGWDIWVRAFASMRYLVNARFLATPTSGVGRVGRELLQALLEEIAMRPAASRPRLEIGLSRAPRRPA